MLTDFLFTASNSFLTKFLGHCNFKYRELSIAVPDFYKECLMSGIKIIETTPKIIRDLQPFLWTEKPFSLVNNRCSDIFTGNIIRINSEYGNNKRNKSSHWLFHSGSISVFAIKSLKIERSSLFDLCFSFVFLLWVPLRSMTELSQLFRSIEFENRTFEFVRLEFFLWVRFRLMAELHRTQSNERVWLSSKTERSMQYAGVNAVQI